MRQRVRTTSTGVSEEKGTGSGKWDLSSGNVGFHRQADLRTSEAGRRGGGERVNMRATPPPRDHHDESERKS